MSKTKKIMFGIAVAAVAGLNVYVANDVIEQRKATSLLNLENISDATEWDMEGSWRGYNLYADVLGNGDILWNVSGPTNFGGFCDKSKQGTCYVNLSGTFFCLGEGSATRLF